VERNPRATLVVVEMHRDDWRAGVQWAENNSGRVGQEKMPSRPPLCGQRSPQAMILGPRGEFVGARHHRKM
jgi:hypothetical protein